MTNEKQEEDLRRATGENIGYIVTVPWLLFVDFSIKNEEYLRNPRQFYSTSLMCSASYWGKLIAGASGKGIFLQSLLTAQLKD